MVRPKLRLISLFDESSFIHIEPSEERRILKMLRRLPHYPEKTPISRLAKDIGAGVIVTANSACRLWGSKRIERTVDGRTEILAEAPIIWLYKAEFSAHANRRKTRYLRPAMYFKSAQS